MAWQWIVLVAVACVALVALGHLWVWSMARAARRGDDQSRRLDEERARGKGDRPCS